MFLVVSGNGKAILSDLPSAKHSFSEDKLISHVEYLMEEIRYSGHVLASPWVLIVHHYCLMSINT